MWESLNPESMIYVEEESRGEEKEGFCRIRGKYTKQGQTVHKQHHREREKERREREREEDRERERA